MSGLPVGAPPLADGLPQPARRQAMLVIILGLTLAVLDSSIVNLALPDIARQLQSGAAQSVWVVNAYQLATLVSLLPLAAFARISGCLRAKATGDAQSHQTGAATRQPR